VSAASEVAHKMLVEMDRHLEEAFKESNEIAAREIENFSEEAMYQEASTDSERSAGVVRVDHVIAAVQLIYAETVFHVVPKFFQSKLLSILTEIERLGVAFIVSKGLKQNPSRRVLTYFFDALHKYLNLTAVHQALEREIRMKSHAIRRDLNSITLARNPPRSRSGPTMTRRPTEKLPYGRNS